MVAFDSSVHRQTNALVFVLGMCCSINQSIPPIDIGVTVL